MEESIRLYASLHFLVGWEEQAVASVSVHGVCFIADAGDIAASTISVSLEESLQLHAVGAEIFAPFVIERLGAGGGAFSAELVVTIVDLSGQTREQAVRLTWQPQSTPAKPLAVQERVRTEWAALGVACALLPVLLGMRVLSVAIEGERFDYRIGNDIGEWGLEVSGTLSESASELRERRQLKELQLRENPARLSGYVVVVGFTLREVSISFHLPYPEETL